MAVRSRSRVLGMLFLAAVAATCMHWASVSFIQPKEPRNNNINVNGLTAGGIALGTAASLATPEMAHAMSGPLTGTAACSAPLIYLIYPLCDPLFLTSPVYAAPLVIAIWLVVVSTIQLLIPATQPDEDLR